MSYYSWPQARTNLLTFQHFYLVGIKGVAMTSLAQCLLDANKKVSGCDVAEEFVTQPLLNQLALKIETGFDHPLPEQTDCLIYTSAHQAELNPMVQQAKKRGLAIFSQAEALASLFNQKQGIAVCGVGGKSTVSAMLSFILEKTNKKPSFSVGVGEIIGLDRTGVWRQNSDIFVAEADEYVINPQARNNGEEIIPRFAFLQPSTIICTNLKFDHPDVYENLEHTKKVFYQFFTQLKPNGKLVFNADNADLLELAQQLQQERPDLKLVSFASQNSQADFYLQDYQVAEATSLSNFQFQNQSYQLKLKIPGQFNMLNALAALASLDFKTENLTALENFASTKRRFEFIGQKNGIYYYDDYAHHPSEVAAVITALQQWHPQQRIVVAFQSHTFSRTKQLFDQFVEAFKNAPEVVMIDIFPSAREAFDASVSSDLLCEKISQTYPQIKCQNLKNTENLAKFCKTELKQGDVFITIGAGDIYLVHDLI